jgi:hypothetical protein
MLAYITQPWKVNVLRTAWSVALIRIVLALTTHPASLLQSEDGHLHVSPDFVQRCATKSDYVSEGVHISVCVAIVSITMFSRLLRSAGSRSNARESGSSHFFPQIPYSLHSVSTCELV